MKEKGKLHLHEAIVVAVINLNKKTFQATCEEIQDYIEKRELYMQEEGEQPIEVQTYLRTFCSQRKYSYLFETVGKDTVKLRMVSKKEKTAV
jgi:hypothetical protein